MSNVKPKDDIEHRMEIERPDKKGIMTKVMSWNVRSINDMSKVKRILEERAVFTLLQEVWQPKEAIDYLLPPSKIKKVRPGGQTGGGTMMMWNSENVAMSGNVYEIN